MALKISVTSDSLNVDFRRAAILSREAGFEGLLIDAYGSTLRVPELSDTGRREFLRVLSLQGQQLVGLQADAPSEGFGPGADVDRLIEGLDGAMEAARALSSPMVCVDVGRLPEPEKAIKATPTVTAEQAGLILLPEAIVPMASRPATRTAPPDPKFVSQVDGALAEAGQRADRYGVMLAMRSELSSFFALSEALRRVRCPWFGIDLDPVAMLRDEWTADEIFSKLGGLIRHIRGRDATRGSNRRTKPTPIGRGDTNWPHLLASLDGAGYSGWVTVDPAELPDRAGAARSGLAQLRKVMESSR